MLKTVFITGASSGIGKAAAELFLAQGWAGAGTSRILSSLEYLNDSPQGHAIEMDVTNEESVGEACRSCVLTFGEVHCIVNNAGVGLAGPLEAISRNELRSLFEINLFGPAAVIRGFLPRLREQRFGTIVNVSSVVGRFAVPFMSPYVASKFALEGLSEAIHFELEAFGVRVKLVEPGGIGSRFQQPFLAHEAYEPDLSKVIRAVRSAERAGKLPSPEVVAPIIFKAATDTSSRLRFPIATQGALTMWSILPSKIWSKLLRRNFGLKSE